MKAGPIEIGRLLLGHHRFCVPIYQRHYVWTLDKQWEPFWNDIRTKAIERLANRQRRFMHYMGAVVLEARGGFSTRHVPSYQVVDGQQRLTTFQLFLCAARDFALKHSFNSIADTISSYLFNDNQRLMEKPEVEIFKVWPTQYDRELFQDILTIKDRMQLRNKYPNYFYAYRDKIYQYKSTPRLLAGYGYFYDRIRHSVETDDLEDEFAQAPEPEAENDDQAAIDAATRSLKLNMIWQSLVEEFKVVEIILEEGDDAQVIFETLNERGEPLLAADLVRNNIFQRADAAREKAEDLFNRHWTRFEDPFWNKEEKQGRYKKPRIEFFLANYIAGQIGGEVNLSKLFSEYKAFLRLKDYPRIADELEEIARFGAIYLELISRSSDSDLAQFSRRLFPWDVTTVYPLAMRIWATNMCDSDKKFALNTLLSYIVRRAICGLTTKNYNKFFLSAIANLDKLGWSLENLTTFILSQNSETARIPDDKEFEQSLINRPIYGALQPSKVCAFLRELELSKRTKYNDTSTLSSDLTIEHVMPDKWLAHWPMINGLVPTQDEYLQGIYYRAEDDTLLGKITRRNRLLNTIGNLTLLTRSLNSSVSNGPFSDKKAALQDHSLLVLNRELIKENYWNEEFIINRSQALAQLAKVIWQTPSLTPLSSKGAD